MKKWKVFIKSCVKVFLRLSKDSCGHLVLVNTCKLKDFGLRSVKGSTTAYECVQGQGR
jgi:hypothetical protein